MIKPKSEDNPAKQTEIKPVVKKSSDLQTDELPSTEQLAMIAAILAGRPNHTPDEATFQALQFWKSAQKMRNYPLAYYACPDHQETPTVLQLATLAGSLATSIKDNPKKLAEAARNIWIAAAGVLDEEIYNFNEHMTHPARFFNNRANPNGHVLRDAFFKEVLPESKKNRTFDMGKIGKAYIRYRFQKRFNKEPTDQEFDDYYAKWNAGSVEEADQLANHDFPEWYRFVYITEARRNAGKASAAKRESKREPLKLKLTPA